MQLMLFYSIEFRSIQSRFSPDNEDDVQAIQGLYECFVDKSEEFKQSHLANVISM